MVRKACAVAIILALAGCDDLPRTHTDAEINDIAQDQADAVAQRLSSRIDDLESQIEDIKADQERDRNLAVSTYNAHESLRKTVNHNVDVNNSEKLREMTRRGACGYEQPEVTPGGGQVWRPKQCTIGDLKP